MVDVALALKSANRLAHLLRQLRSKSLGPVHDHKRHGTHCQERQIQESLQRL